MILHTLHWPSMARCDGCHIEANMVLKFNRHDQLTHAWLPDGWREADGLHLCPECKEHGAPAWNSAAKDALQNGLEKFCA